MQKLVKKNADYIIANDVTEEGAGFGIDTNRVTLFGRDDVRQQYPQMSKQLLARQLLEMIAKREWSQ